MFLPIIISLRRWRGGWRQWPSLTSAKKKITCCGGLREYGWFALPRVLDAMFVVGADGKFDCCNKQSLFVLAVSLKFVFHTSFALKQRCLLRWIVVSISNVYERWNIRDLPPDPMTSCMSARPYGFEACKILMCVIYLFSHPSIHLFFGLCIYLCRCLRIYLSVCVFICLSIRFSLSLSLYMFVCRSICQRICLPNH